MSDVSKNWLDEINSEMFEPSECPEYDMLIKYSKGKLDGVELRQIEKHMIDCDLCASIVNIPESVSVQEINKVSKSIISKLESDINKVKQVNSDFNPFTTSISKIYNLVFGTPSFKYVLSTCAGLVLIAFISFQFIKPDYYDLAKLNKQEKEMILLSVDNQRSNSSEELNNVDFSILLDSEKSILGFIPQFDENKLNQSLTILNNAIAETEDLFYKEKYSYFIGKIYLMKADKINAVKWLNKVLEFNSETLYSKFAKELLESVK